MMTWGPNALRAKLPNGFISTTNPTAAPSIRPVVTRNRVRKRAQLIVRGSILGRIDDADVRGDYPPALGKAHPALHLPADLAGHRRAVEQRGGDGEVAAVGGDHRARAR